MQLSEFDFDLPESFIGQNPAFPRDYAKLMVLNRVNQSIEHRHFYDLPQLLTENDILVVNNSKVIPARINFIFNEKKAEIFLLKKVSEGCFECLVKPGKYFIEGANAQISSELWMRVTNVLGDGSRLIAFFDSAGAVAADEFIFKHGQTPLPPYIKNSSAEMSDYQTVYAKDFGSVAAPTAGLHFTDELLQKLKTRGVQLEEVLLHVNRGTFLPVKTEQITDHKMHSEFFTLSVQTAEALNKAKQACKRIIAVGTTSVRVLESSYQDDQFKPQSGETDIFIYPGYQWKCVDALITNFHLPKSSLLMLVSSFAGKDFVMQAYEEAKKQDYKFFSFGDGMLII